VQAAGNAAMEAPNQKARRNLFFFMALQTKPDDEKVASHGSVV
jgi:hypothetical protein